MKTFVYWFLAPPEDAAAIRSIVTTEARKLEEWPHLVLSGVDGMEVNELEKLARPKRPKGSSRIGGKLLDRSKMSDTPFTAVSRVTPEFVQALADLDDAAATEIGQRWAEKISGVSTEAAARLVVQMAAFARQSATAGLPMLELALF